TGQSQAGQPIVMHKVRVEKLDPDFIRVTVNYECARPPNPKKVYRVMVTREDWAKKQLSVSGREIWRGPGDKLPMKGEARAELGLIGLGSGEQYRVWMADDDDIGVSDPRVTIFKTVASAAPGKDGPPRAKLAVTLSNIRVEVVDDTHVRVSADYEFAEQPIANKSYCLVCAPVGAEKGLIPPVRQELGNKWDRKGRVQSVLIQSRRAEQYRVWMAENTGFMYSTSTVVVPGVAGKG